MSDDTIRCPRARKEDKTEMYRWYCETECKHAPSCGALGQKKNGKNKTTEAIQRKLY